MRKVIACSGLIAIFAVFGFGQKQKQSPEDVPTPERSTKAAPMGQMIDANTVLSGQLENTIDVKKAKVGDQVVLRSTSSVKQDGETVIPKGSKLIGRVTEVQKRSKHNGGSKLGMVFDRIQGKRLDMPITASIMSITNAAGNARMNDLAAGDVFGSAGSSTTASTSGSGGGGGLLGGVTNTVGGTVGGLVNTTSQTVGGVTGAATQTVGSATGLAGGALNAIQISNSTSGSANASTTLSAADRNIRIEKGATFQLQLSNASKP